MRVLLVYNPISGAGRAAAAAAAMAEALRRAGHEAIAQPTQLDPLRQWLDPALAGMDVMVVAGGDGAMRLAAPAAARTGVAIYHLPHGTENLFARDFGMDARPETLLAALERMEVRTVDVGMANGRMFLLMASIGFDANVVHDLAARRQASISHLSYLGPVLRQFMAWKPALLEVRVDGQPLGGGTRGFIVVANCREYGWRLNPGGRGSMTDGLLEVALFPARSRLDLVGWIIRCRNQRHYGDPRLHYRQGRHIEIACARPEHYQLDGDPPGVVHELERMDEDDSVRVSRLSIEVKPAALRVLACAPSPSR